MEWEEALLEAWGEEMAPHSADHYRRKAARARQLAEGVTTEAMKERLLDDCAHSARKAILSSEGGHSVFDTFAILGPPPLWRSHKAPGRPPGFATRASEKHAFPSRHYN